LGQVLISAEIGHMGSNTKDRLAKKPSGVRLVGASVPYRQEMAALSQKRTVFGQSPKEQVACAMALRGKSTVHENQRKFVLP
jgi:hypothetical protein